MTLAGFIIIASMLTFYVLLDGWDLGVAAIAPFVARTSRERFAAMQAIGPFWNGNEVWLIAAGGALFAIFPKAYASSFSGFYLPFMIVLWLLMFRGISLELRGHLKDELWHTFWDVCFSGSSMLLSLLFGVALGNLIRGVPLDRAGYFQGTFAFLLNPYALLVGFFAVLALAQHGLAFLLLRIEGPVAERAMRIRNNLWIAVVAAYAAVSAGTFVVRGGPPAPLPIELLALAAIGALIALRVVWSRSALLAFGASTLFLGTLLVQSAGTLYPYLLRGFPSGGLSVDDATPPGSALVSAFTVIIVGLIAVAIYGAYVWKHLFASPASSD